MQSERNLLNFFTQTLILNLIKGKRCAVLIIRGGLGNQLYKLSALAFYCKVHNLKPFVFVFDIDSVHGKNHSLTYKTLNVRSWFSEEEGTGRLHILQNIDQLLIRGILKLNRVFGLFHFYSDGNIDSLSVSTRKLILFRGSFQDKKYPLSLSHDFHLTFFTDPKRLPRLAPIALHIRLTDFLPTSPFDKEYYEIALKKAHESGSLELDCYSDNISHAKELLGNSNDAELFWPEENQVLRSDEFLFQFSQYNSFIASKSSLCWWACFLAWKRNPNIAIIHPWADIEDFASNMSMCAETKIARLD
jgi:hypothetical protein